MFGLCHVILCYCCPYVIFYGCKNELLGGGPCSPSAFLFVSLTFFSTYAYITYQDIKQLGNLEDQTVIVVKAPTDTKLEVTDPDEVCAPNVKPIEAFEWRVFNPTLTCST